MGGIVIDEIVGQPGDVFDAGGASLQLQATFDQLSGACADHIARRIQGDGRQTLAVEHEIERVDQVGRRIDERAVKIEDDSARRSSEIAIGPRPIMQVGDDRLLHNRRRAEGIMQEVSLAKRHS